MLSLSMDDIALYRRDIIASYGIDVGLYGRNVRQYGRNIDNIVSVAIGSQGTSRSDGTPLAGGCCFLLFRVPTINHLV